MRRGKLSTVEVWRGPSQYTGAPVVVILSGLSRASQNAKTGAMVQAWILPAGADPVSAVRTGRDVDICGACPLRGDAHAEKTKRRCYVNVGRAPAGIWRAWKAGKVPVVTSEIAASLLAGKALRVGAYGDPAAVPVDVWRPLVDAAAYHTGYSHGGISPTLPAQTKRALEAFTMVSADDASGAIAARNRGARSFRVIGTVSEKLEFEILCPASPEGGSRTQCINCGLCDGAGNAPGRKSIAIVDHGPQRVAIRRAAETAH